MRWNDLTAALVMNHQEGSHQDNTFPFTSHLLDVTQKALLLEKLSESSPYREPPLTRDRSLHIVVILDGFRALSDPAVTFSGLLGLIEK